MSLVKQSYLGRTIALFFILFAFADLSIPQLCSEEFGGCSLPSSNLESSSYQSDRLSLSAPGQTQQQQSESGEHFDEDCFCCCSHIVPGSHFTVAIVELISPI